MQINVLRYNSESDFTNGLVHIDGKFECFTIEDEGREVKKKGETRIPEGTYEIGLRTVGGFNSRYTKKFGSDFHKGMLQIKDVPNFEYILVHMGNTDDDTAGCLIVGSVVDIKNKGFMRDSKTAYVNFYSKAIKAIERGEEVKITFTTIG